MFLTNQLESFWLCQVNSLEALHEAELPWCQRPDLLMPLSASLQNLRFSSTFLNYKNTIKNNDFLNLTRMEANFGDGKYPWLDIYRGMWRIDFTVNKLSAVPPLVALGRLRFACFATNEITSLEVGFVGSCWWEQGRVGIELLDN